MSTPDPPVSLDFEHEDSLFVVHGVLLGFEKRVPLWWVVKHGGAMPGAILAAWNASQDPFLMRSVWFSAVGCACLSKCLPVCSHERRSFCYTCYRFGRLAKCPSCMVALRREATDAELVSLAPRLLGVTA